MPALRAGVRDGRGRDERRPDQTLVDHRSRRLQASAEERVRCRSDAHARGGGRIEEPARVLARGRERLLGVDVLAGGDRSQRDRGVRRGWRQDERDVDRWVGQDRLDGHRWKAAGNSQRLRPLPIEVSAGGELQRLIPGRPFQVEVGDVAGPDDRDAGGTIHPQGTRPRPSPCETR